ncbi:MAG TPA: CoA-binding protein [Desulfomonilaceae bacterium]|nr:CoA-binding protein [Desulfomonilaceae bacterium]
MNSDLNLEVFLNPKSVAVIGASQRPVSWGSFIMKELLSTGFSGRIYPVNNHSEEVFGIPTLNDVSEIKEQVDLAILIVPDEFVEETVAACAQHGIKGVTIVSAGFGEISELGKEREESLVRLAGASGMRILGPNVSGSFNFHSAFNASPYHPEISAPTPLAAVCQGGYAMYDLLASGSHRGMGVGQFIHTGNECDLTVTDFLEHFGFDPHVEGILAYIEGIRDGRRFIKIAREVTKRKPVVLYKAGQSTGSARAAQSHTGALSGQKEIYNGIFRQVGIIISPTMELLLPVGHALIERPRLRGSRIGIVTMGGSWGVALSDSLEAAGLVVPEFSPRLRKALGSMGLPVRASTRNPVDWGASGLFGSVDILLRLARGILESSEVDALVVHGFGRPGLHDENTPVEMKVFLEIEKQMMQAVQSLEKEMGIPVLIGSHHSIWESQAILDLNAQGIRIYNRLDEIAQLLSLMLEYGTRNSDCL